MTYNRFLQMSEWQFSPDRVNDAVADIDIVGLLIANAIARAIALAPAISSICF
jgi:hypothetical protein